MPADQPSDRPLVIMDADDTLWHTAVLFEEARQAIEGMVAAAGHDGAEWRELQVAEDMALIPTHHFNQYQFVEASVNAYRQLAAASGAPVDEALANAIHARAHVTASARPAPIPGAEEMLRALSRTHRLVLLTKGDPAVQSHRILSSGLGGYFEKVLIVDDKTPAVFQGICLACGVTPGDAWAVGNSLRSDINPALRAGLRGVLIDAEMGVWAYERDAVPVAGVLHRAATVQMVSGIIAARERGERRGHEGRGGAEIA